MSTVIDVFRATKLKLVVKVLIDFLQVKAAQTKRLGPIMKKKKNFLIDLKLQVSCIVISTTGSL